MATTLEHGGMVSHDCQPDKTWHQGRDMPLHMAVSVFHVGGRASLEWAAHSIGSMYMRTSACLYLLLMRADTDIITQNPASSADQRPATPQGSEVFSITLGLLKHLSSGLRNHWLDSQPLLCADFSGELRLYHVG